MSGSRDTVIDCVVTGAGPAGLAASAALRPGPWFAEVRSLVLSSLPQAEDVVIAGADHSLATAHPAEIAAALVPFLRRHPVKGQAPRTRR